MKKPKKCKKCRLLMVWCESSLGRVLWCVNLRCSQGPGLFVATGREKEPASASAHTRTVGERSQST